MVYMVSILTHKMASKQCFCGYRGVTWLDGLDGALIEGDDVAGVGNTETVPVEDGNVDEDGNTETEMVTIERTEE